MSQPVNPLPRNIPLFIAFRVLFNARFYYPIFGILFLDLGLTLEQFALLNVVWAVVIVTLEIPSGALADWLGRRTLVVVAAGLMVVEMSLLALAPTGHPTLLFWLLLLNRVLSGAAEAAASGADEALAFDSLPEKNREVSWPQVLARLMRWKSGAFFIAMVTGAVLYDAQVLGVLTSWTGWQPAVGSTVRWPVYACLITSVLCFSVAWQMQEPPRARRHKSHLWRETWRTILQGAQQVFTVRRIFLLMVAALLCDSFVRLFLTLASNYYRLIELPPAVNGLLGSALAVLGFIAAPWARNCVVRFSVRANFLGIAALVLTGLGGVAMTWAVWGAWVIVPLGLAMAGLQFFTSHYLNLWTASEIRATVLSFRGVAFNLGYGALGLGFAGLSNAIRHTGQELTENEVLAQALPWVPASFLVLGLASWWILSPHRSALNPGNNQ
jgi:MFS family permease